MKIKLIRDRFTDRATLGELFINDAPFCYTLEDKVRPEGEKVYGETAIPEGTYKVIISHSAKFKRDMLEILDVPGFRGIRIHGGNTVKDTFGCPLVAFHRDNRKEMIWGNMEKPLLSLVKGAQSNGEECFIEITHKEDNCGFMILMSFQ